LEKVTGGDGGDKKDNDEDNKKKGLRKKASRNVKQKCKNNKN